MWDDFDPGEVRDLLPYLIVLEPIGEPARFFVRLYGTAVAALRGHDLTGRYTDEPGALPAELLSQFEASYAEALAARQPVTGSAWIQRHLEDTMLWQHSRVVLPFARNDGTAASILLVAFIPAGGPKPLDGTTVPA